MHPVEDIGISPWPVDVADAYAHRKQVYVRQLYNQVPQTAWVSRSSCYSWSQLGTRCQRESQRHTEGSSSLATMRKKCCYGQKNLGSICSSLSPSPTHLSRITNINPFSRIKCEKYVFIKKCVRSFIEVVIIVDYVSAYICIMYMYICIMSIQHLSLSFHP